MKPGAAARGVAPWLAAACGAVAAVVVCARPASGCCGSGYAHDATYHAMRPASPEDPAMPTLSLLQCQKD